MRFKKNKRGGRIAQYKDPDIIKFYNSYLERQDKDLRLDVIKSFNEHKPTLSNNILLVIDMQYDFLDTPPPEPAPQKPGAFAVVASGKIPAQLAKYIKENKSVFSKIIFSRDFHDPDHCSFYTVGGDFPPHCQVNSIGAQIHSDFNQFRDYDNVEVIFKGMAKQTDSFGAFKYPLKTPEDRQYANSRQIGKHCCKPLTSEQQTAPLPGSLVPATCGNLTGGFKRINENKLLDWEVKAFPDATDGAGVMAKCTAVKLKDLGITDGANVYIVGLAGDYCVRDTALNIVRTATAENIKKC